MALYKIIIHAKKVKIYSWFSSYLCVLSNRFYLVPYESYLSLNFKEFCGHPQLIRWFNFYAKIFFKSEDWIMPVVYPVNLVGWENFFLVGCFLKRWSIKWQWKIFLGTNNREKMLSKSVRQWSMVKKTNTTTIHSLSLVVTTTLQLYHYTTTIHSLPLDVTTALQVFIAYHYILLLH